MREKYFHELTFLLLINFTWTRPVQKIFFLWLWFSRSSQKAKILGITLNFGLHIVKQNFQNDFIRICFYFIFHTLIYGKWNQLIREFSLLVTWYKWSLNPAISKFIQSNGRFLSSANSTTASLFFSFCSPKKMCSWAIFYHTNLTIFKFRLANFN